jgi:septal ring factor EnvC (AmiA/AmiB activator)
MQGASGTALVQRLQHLQALLCAELSSPTPAAPPPTACGLHATEQVHAELAAAEAQPAALRAELEQLRQRQQADAVQLAALGAALAASEQQRAALEAELADTAQAAYELWEVVQVRHAGRPGQRDGVRACRTV